MKLPLAVLLGAIASVAVPTALSGAAGMFGDFVRDISGTIRVGGQMLRFSLPILLLVTAFCWAFFVWSDK